MNIRNLRLSILILLMYFSATSQEKTYEKLGDLILESVAKNDATLFKSLIIPEEAVWENLKKMYASEWTKEQEQQAFLNLPENYKNTVENDFMMTFSTMVTKAEIFKLNFESIVFEILDDQDKLDKTIGVVRVFGTIDHPKFKYFSFGMIGYKDQYYIVDSRVDISEVNKYSERDFLNNVAFTANNNGAIQSEGSLRITSTKSDSEVFQCIIDNLTLFGVEDTHVSVDDFSSSYLKGKWEYPYRINDTEDYICLVSFDFEYILENGVLAYVYSNYVHHKDDSNYESVGVLPLAYNTIVGKEFTKNEYYELVYDTEVNLKIAIKRLKQSVDKCH